MAQTDMTMPPAQSPRPPAGPGVWSGLGITALYFVLQLVASIALMLIMVVVWAMLQENSESAREALMSMQRMPAWVMVTLTIGSIVLAAGPTLWLVHRLWPRLWSQARPPGLGLAWPVRRSWFALAAVAGIAAAFASNGLTMWLLQGRPLDQDVTVLAREAGPALRVALALVVVLVAPLIEEVVFRGVLLSGLMRRMSATWAVVFSSLLFGVVHLADFKFAWYPIPGLVLLGAVLAVLRLRSGSLWAAITAHAANNLLGVLVWFLASPGSA